MIETVGELIEELSRFPKDMPVVSYEGMEFEKVTQTYRVMDEEETPVVVIY